MNKEQYRELNTLEIIPIPIIRCSDLTNKEDRILLKGYTPDRVTWVVELEDENIYVYTNRLDGTTMEMFDVNDNTEYVPNKRVYPHCSDYEFCKLLIERGVNIPFTTYAD